MGIFWRLHLKKSYSFDMAKHQKCSWPKHKCIKMWIFTKWEWYFFTFYNKYINNIPIQIFHVLEYCKLRKNGLHLCRKTYAIIWRWDTNQGIALVGWSHKISKALTIPKRDSSATKVLHICPIFRGLCSQNTRMLYSINL